MKNRIKIVFKIEIETLFDNNGILSIRKMEQLSMICANLNNSGVSVLLVSSGAIALGAAKLGLVRSPSDIIAKQAVAAVGQAELIISYQDCFDHFDQMVAQVLLTRDVIDNPLRNRNAKNTLSRLLDQGIIPVINENDSVSTNDIIMNDNYPLALIVASLTDADAIVVNTYDSEKFLLLLRNNSGIREAGIEELLDISDNITGGRYDTDQNIEGFPEFNQYAGLN
jgi:glutamate 5-kinase